MTQMIQNTAGNVKGARVCGSVRGSGRGRQDHRNANAIEKMRRLLDWCYGRELATKIKRYWSPYDMTADDYMQVFGELHDGVQAELRSIAINNGFKVEDLEFLFPCVISFITR